MQDVAIHFLNKEYPSFIAKEKKKIFFYFENSNKVKNRKVLFIVYKDLISGFRKKKSVCKYIKMIYTTFFFPPTIFISIKFFL